MTRSRLLPFAALAVGLFLAAGGTAQQTKNGVVTGQPAPGGAAAEIPVVPKSAAAFVSVKVSDLVDHPDLKAALEQLKKTPDATDGLTEHIGVLPHEIDRVTLFWPTLGPRGPGAAVLVVTTRQPYNEARVLKALMAEPVFDGDFGNGGGGAKWQAQPRISGAKRGVPAVADEPIPAKAAKPVAIPPKEPPPPPEFEDACTATTAAAPPGDPLFFTVPRGGPFQILFLIDDRTLVFLPDDFDRGITHLTLLAHLMQKKSTGPLAEAIATAGNHTLAAGVHLPPLFREFDRGLPPEFAPYAALFATRTAVVSGDLNKTAKLTVRLSFDDATAARRAGPVLEEGLKTLAEKANEIVAEMKGRASEKAFVPLVEAAVAGLRKATVKTDGATVVATGEVDVAPAAARAAGEFLQSFASRKKFLARSNNLKQIGIALHAYQDVYGKLPTNAYGPKGEMLLSWRVQLLPYLEEADLYRQFKLDEPWDSENNKKLIDKMPKVFEVLGREAPKGKTFLQGFAAPDPRKVKVQGGGGGQFAPFGTPWLQDGNPQGTSLAQITDGTSNTIAVVEAREAVIWSKPEDLPFTEKLPALGAEGADQFLALLLDGSVRALPTRIKPETLRALITTNGGEVIDFDQLDGERPRFPARPGGGGAVESKPSLPVKSSEVIPPKPPEKG